MASIFVHDVVALINYALIVLIHLMREGDEKMTPADLVKKFPHTKSQEIVSQGCR
jgi:hypothetical protein